MADQETSGSADATPTDVTQQMTDRAGDALGKVGDGSEQIDVAGRAENATERTDPAVAGQATGCADPTYPTEAYPIAAGADPDPRQYLSQPYPQPQPFSPGQPYPQAGGPLPQAPAYPQPYPQVAQAQPYPAAAPQAYQQPSPAGPAGPVGALQRARQSRPWLTAVIGAVAGVLVFCLGIGLGYAIGHANAATQDRFTQLGPGGSMNQGGPFGSRDGSGSNQLPQIPGFGGSDQSGQSQDGQGQNGQGQDNQDRNGQQGRQNGQSQSDLRSNDSTRTSLS